MMETGTGSDSGAGSGAVSDPGRSRSSRRRRLLSWLLGLVVLYLLIAGGLLWSARSDVLAGRDALTTLAATDPLAGDLEVVRADLVQAGGPVSSGASKLGSPFLWPLRPVPVIGRQMASARSLATVAETVVDDAVIVVDDALVLQEANESGRLVALAALEGSLSRLNDHLDKADLGPDRALIGSLADARATAEAQLADVGEQTAGAEVVVRGLQAFLGRSDYLILAANINEMQVGGGTPLSLGTIAIEDGGFSVSGIESVLGVVVPPGVPAADPDVEALWGFLSPTNDFKKLMLSARFDSWGGPQGLALYEATFGPRLDGTLLLDPVALEALLTVVGPVVVDGDTYTSDNVLRYIFVDQYDEFLLGTETTDNLSTFTEADDIRRDRLADIASQTVALLATEDWDPVQLINALRPVAAGRHLLAYASDPAEQRMWESLGVAGVSDGDELGVALLNIGANKIDPFVAVSVDVQQTEVDGGAAGSQTALELAITIKNDTPPGLDPGITGYYWETIGLPSAASYLGRLTLLMPGTTTELDLVEGQENLRIEAFGHDGPMAMMVVRLEPIAEGTSATVRVRALLSSELTSVEVLPSARYIPITYAWDGATFDDAIRHRRELGN